MKTQQIGIVSAPTPITLAYVADYQRRKAEAKRKQDLAQVEREQERAAKDWQKPNKPFTGLVTLASELQRKCAEAAYIANNGRLPNGKFASRQQAKQDADKLSALGFGGSK